jgi:hypothetical protein
LNKSTISLQTEERFHTWPSSIRQPYKWQRLCSLTGKCCRN